MRVVAEVDYSGDVPSALDKDVLSALDGDVPSALEEAPLSPALGGVPPSSAVDKAPPPLFFPSTSSLQGKE